MTSGILGDCSDKNGRGPYSGPLDDFAAELRINGFDKLYNDNYDELEIDRLNTNVEGIGIDAGKNLVGVAASFIEDIADIVPCSEVSDIKESLIYPVCTSTVGALGWYLGCLYLMAWTLCCLAIPAGCLVEYENEQRSKEYAAYRRAFEASDEGDYDEEQDDESYGSESEIEEPRYLSKRMPEDTAEEQEEVRGGAYAVLGPKRDGYNDVYDTEYPSAPVIAVVPQGYYNEDDDIEMM